jgi:AraC-like DNA-binding protein/ligand-binding sensor protein
MSNKAGHSDNHQRSSLDILSGSEIYVQYQRAFAKATGLPLDLHAPGMFRLVRYPKKQASPFCLLMAKTSAACASCYALQQELEQQAQFESRTLKCFAGLCESAVPVRLGDKLIAFLHTGQVLLHTPRRRGFNRIAAKLLKWRSEIDLKSAEEAYFQTRVLEPRQYESMIWLLGVFAGHLAICGNKLLLRAKVAEPAAVSKARDLIGSRHTDSLSLGHVARAVNVSANHFSRLFRQTAGMTFVEYVGRVRVEKAKNLLQNPTSKISMVAFASGFQSLSQFNRVFKKVVGHSPKEFRGK